MEPERPLDEYIHNLNIQINRTLIDSDAKIAELNHKKAEIIAEHQGVEEKLNELVSKAQQIQNDTLRRLKASLESSLDNDIRDFLNGTISEGEFQKRVNSRTTEVAQSEAQIRQEMLRVMDAVAMSADQATGTNCLHELVIKIRDNTYDAAQTMCKFPKNAAQAAKDLAGGLYTTFQIVGDFLSLFDVAGLESDALSARSGVSLSARSDVSSTDSLQGIIMNIASLADKVIVYQASQAASRSAASTVGSNSSQGSSIITAFTAQPANDPDDESTIASPEDSQLYSQLYSPPYSQQDYDADNDSNFQSDDNNGSANKKTKLNPPDIGGKRKSKHHKKSKKSKKTKKHYKKQRGGKKYRQTKKGYSKKRTLKRYKKRAYK